MPPTVSPCTSRARHGAVLLGAALSILSLLEAGPAQSHLSIIRQGPESRGAQEAGDALGSAVAVGDFNNDGRDDVAMGSPGEDVSGATDAGAVIVNYGASKGVTNAGAQIYTQSELGSSPIANSEVGYALGAGNFNGDAYDDLVVGAPGEPISGAGDVGVVYVLYGGPGGLQFVTYLVQSGNGGADEGGDRFGSAFGIGNFDGDAQNRDDFAVGAPGEDAGAGAVFQYLGTGFAPLANGWFKQSSLGFGDNAGDGFGFSMAAGNFTGGSQEDLAIGAPFRTEVTSSDAGRVYILQGTAAGLTAVSAFNYNAQSRDALQTNGRFGSALAAGSFFSGSYASLAVGEPGRTVSGQVNAGRVLVGKGALSGLSFGGASGITLLQSAAGGAIQPGDSFGAALAGGKYWDPDSFDDLAVGAPGEANSAGAVSILSGGPNGPTGAYGWTGLTQSNLGESNEPGDSFGRRLEFGHVDDSGRGALIAAAPGERLELPNYQPTTFLDDAGLVHVIALWRQPVNLACRTSLEGDCGDNLVFTQKPFEQVKIASTTKVMTVLLACEHIQAGDVSLGDTYLVPWYAASDGKIGGSQANPPFATFELLTLQDMLYYTIFHSANEATYCIGDLINGGGGQFTGLSFQLNNATFVVEMNQRAAQIGMTGTQFTNPNGFDKKPSWLPTSGDHHSTAYDMWLLCRTAMNNPLFRQIVGAKTYTVSRTGVPPTISYGWGVVNQPGVIGIKPGGTPLAATTGTWAAKPSYQIGQSIGGAYGHPNGTQLTDAVALMNTGLAQCFLPLIFPNNDPQPFIFANLSTAFGAIGGGASQFEGAGNLDLDIFRQEGHGLTSALVELGRTSEVVLDPGEIADFGIDPFSSHRGFVISNPESLSKRIHITINGGPGAGFYTIPPESSVTIPPHTNGGTAPGYMLQIQNTDTGPDPLDLTIEELYEQPCDNVPEPRGGPFKTLHLTRSPLTLQDGFWLRSTGRDPEGDGGTLFVALHDPRITVGVGDGPPPPTPGFRVVSAAPNPFRSWTRLAFDLDAPAVVEAAIYDVAGRRVRTFAAHPFGAGRQGHEWDGRSDAGHEVPPGLYFYRASIAGVPAATLRVVRAR